MLLPKEFLLYMSKRLFVFPTLAVADYPCTRQPKLCYSRGYLSVLSKPVLEILFQIFLHLWDLIICSLSLVLFKWIIFFRLFLSSPTIICTANINVYILFLIFSLSIPLFYLSIHLFYLSIHLLYLSMRLFYLSIPSSIYLTLF